MKLRRLDTAALGVDGVARALDRAPESVDAAGDRLVATLEVLSFGPIGSDDTGLLTEPLTLLVSDNDGPRSFTIAQDEIPAPQSLRLITDGYVERWPFDSHSVDLVVISLQETDGEPTVVPTLLCGSAHVPGWTFASEEIAGTDELVIDGEPVTQVRIIATRSVATVAEMSVPNGTARSFSCASVICLERLPTYNFIGAPAGHSGGSFAAASTLQERQAQFERLGRLRGVSPEDLT